MMPSDKGLVFDIRRYAINDGPGIRVAVFLQGCNLNCAWCHNPEGIPVKPVLLYAHPKCIQCSTCVSVCPEGALTLTGGKIVIDHDRCTLCDICTGVCPTKALEMSGQYMTVEEIMEILEKERAFFEESGGGVTFTGGEPMLQKDFLIEALRECGRRGIHRAVDTAGNVKTETILEVAAHTDLFLYDLKMMDTELHRQWTGSGNERILHNLTTIGGLGIPLIIRIPVIGSVNDDEDNFRETAAFLASLKEPVKEIHLLPYHAIAQHKYQKLGRPEDFQRFEEPDDAILDAALEIFRQQGFSARTGG